MGMESFKPSRESKQNDEERIKDKEKAERMARAGDIHRRAAVGERGVASSGFPEIASMTDQDGKILNPKEVYEHKAEFNDKMAENYEDIEGNRYDQEKELQEAREGKRPIERWMEGKIK